MTENVPPPNDNQKTDLVRRAVIQLKAYGDFNRGQVRHVLPYWRHFVLMSPAEMLAVVDSFPPGEDNSARMPGQMIGGNR